jgi:hypothetical protein
MIFSIFIFNDSLIQVKEFSVIFDSAKIFAYSFIFLVGGYGKREDPTLGIAFQHNLGNLAAIKRQNMGLELTGSLTIYLKIILPEWSI